MNDKEKSTQMAVANQDYKLALEPKDFEQALKTAEFFAAANVEGVKTKEEALARLMRGRVLGVSAAQSQKMFFNIDNKTGMYADAMHAIAKASPLCEQIKLVESSDRRAIYRIKRRGEEPQEFSWTIEDAQRAGLLSQGDRNKSWHNYPRQKLRARAKAEGLREVFPDLFHGMYTEDELGDGDMGGGESTQEEPSDELEGEVVPPQQPVVQAAARDWQKEFGTKLQAIRAMKSKADLNKVVKELEAWDAPLEWKQKIQGEFNTFVEAARAARAPQAPPAPGSAPKAPDSVPKASPSTPKASDSRPDGGPML